MRRVLLGLLGVALAVGGLIGVGWWNIALPAAINMSQRLCAEGHASDGHGQHERHVPAGKSSASAATGIPIASWQAPLAAAHTDTFTLTAQPAQLEFGAGVRADA